MPSVEIHSLAWPNTDPRIVSGHTAVMDALNLKVSYTLEQADHGLWMDAMVSSSKADIVGFLDIDCIPTSKDAVPRAVEWVARNQSLLGIAQVSNHIPPASHIYAAPAFYFIWRQAWEDMGKPTFAATPHGDVAENVSYAAELHKKPYKTLFPVAYTTDPQEGAWRLHTYGKYGIGTVFENNVYHLYQSRMSQNIELFCNACKVVVDNPNVIHADQLGAYIKADRR